MFPGVVLACILLAPFQPQAPSGPPPNGGQQQAQTVKPPTPWFDKDEDTFELPKDPKHLADLKRDVDRGKSDVKLVFQVYKPSTNMAYQERVERLGQQIAHIANHMHAVALFGDKRHNVYHYHYTVLQGDDVNAFSLSGGYIFVFEGLMKFVESDDELAGVLAHETAHAAFRHVAIIQQKEDKAEIYQIPAIIAAILAHSPEGLLTTQLLSQAIDSNWGIQAEEAADYGGFQFMCHSSYNPVAMLTFMERLGKHDSALESEIKWTIFQTHPLSRERVEAFVADLQAADIPIERSKASPSFRVLLKPNPDGTIAATFNDLKIYTFGGDDAKERAEAAVARLNKFYDAVPKLYEVSEDTSQTSVMWKGVPVLTVEPADAEAAHESPEDLLDRTLTQIKSSLFNLDYRIWEGPDF